VAWNHSLEKEEAPNVSRYWKGNLHTHSFWSDGDDFPEMIADWYKQHGYQFLALTDHNVLSEGERWIDIPEKGVRPQALTKYRTRFGNGWVETRTLKEKEQVRLKPLREFRSLLEEPGKFLLVPAEEITHRFGKAPVHMNGINLRDVITPTDGKDINETIRVNLGAVRDQQKRTGWKMIAFLNHPNFQWGVRAEDMVEADDLRFFEVFNGHAGVRNYGDAQHASCERIWDIVNSLRLGKHKMPLLYGLATDDAHGYHEFGVGKINPGRGWVMVQANHLTPEAMVQGILNGNFYASTGVEMKSIQFVDNQLLLEIRGEKGVEYQTEFIATLKDAPLDSKPLLDEKGNELPVTRIYSEEVGKVVALSKEINPRYKLTGKELFVRARITSTKPHPNPYQKGDTEMAWIQPVVGK
jgi:hypothetical protein